MHILHLLSSPRGAASESRQLSSLVLHHLQQRAGAAPITLEELDTTTLAHVDSDYAMTLGGHHPSLASSPPTGALAESDRLIHALDRADCLVIATPMHNYTVPSGLKAWIDHIVRAHRTFQITPQGKIGALRERPVFVVVSTGGMVSGPHARQPDFLRPYLQTVLATIGLKNITFFTVEGTARHSAALADARQQAQQTIFDYFSSPALQH